MRHLRDGPGGHERQWAAGRRPPHRRPGDHEDLIMIMRTMKTMVTMIAHPDHRLPLRCAQLPGLQVPRQGLHSGNIGRLLSADVLQRF